MLHPYLYPVSGFMISLFASQASDEQHRIEAIQELWSTTTMAVDCLDESGAQRHSKPILSFAANSVLIQSTTQSFDIQSGDLEAVTHTRLAVPWRGIARVIVTVRNGVQVDNERTPSAVDLSFVCHSDSTTPSRSCMALSEEYAPTDGGNAVSQRVQVADSTVNFCFSDDAEQKAGELADQLQVVFAAYDNIAHVERAWNISSVDESQ